MPRNRRFETGSQLRRAESLLWDTMEYLESQGYDETEEFKALQAYFGILRHIYDTPESYDGKRYVV